MKLEHEFTVPVGVEQAWPVLLDVERVAPCMPGAALLSVDGDDFTGTVKVKVGPIQVTYRGQARFAERDDSAHRVVIEASGKEARGSGTASATVTAVLLAAGDASTKVRVETDLNVTGRPAQFGRGVMAEVGAKLVNQFAQCLSEEIAGGGTPAAAPPGTDAGAAEPAHPVPTAAPATAASGATAPDAPSPSDAEPPGDGEPPKKTAAPSAPPPPAATASAARAAPAATPPRRSAEPIDLLEVAGGSVAKRLAPVAAVVALLLLLLWRRRRS